MRQHPAWSSISRTTGASPKKLTARASAARTRSPEEAGVTRGHFSGRSPAGSPSRWDLPPPWGRHLGQSEVTARVRWGLLIPLNFSPPLALVFQTTFKPCVIGCPWWRQCGSWWRRMTLFWHRLVPCVLLGCSHRRRVRGQVVVHSSFGQLLYFIFYGDPTVCPSGGGSFIWALLFLCL